MAMYLFTDAIIKHKPLNIFNNGNLSRDFTYIDDIINGVIATLTRKAKHNNDLWQIYNIGNSKPIRLIDFIESIECHTGIKAIRNYQPMQPGDVNTTWADITEIVLNYDYNPETDINIGVGKFVSWYNKYYNQQ